MTKKIAQYGVLSHYPLPHRTEHVHIGIACFLPEGVTRVHFGDDLKKLRAMDPTTDLDAVRSWESGLPQLVAGMSAGQAANFIRNFGQWSISEVTGSFVHASDEEYLGRVAHALRNLVAPPARSLREDKSRN